MGQGLSGDRPTCPAHMDEQSNLCGFDGKIYMYWSDGEERSQEGDQVLNNPTRYFLLRLHEVFLLLLYLNQMKSS